MAYNNKNAFVQALARMLGWEEIAQGVMNDTQDAIKVETVASSTTPLPSGAATSLKQDTGNGSLASIDDAVGSQTSTTVPATPSTAATLIDKITGFWTELAALAVSIKAWILNPFVGGQFKRVAGTSFVRPGTVGTAVPGTVINQVTTPIVITFPSCARANGGSGILKAAFTNIKWPSGTPVATGFAHRLKIFNVAPTAVADGTNWAVNQSNFAAWQGSFDFNGLNGEGATQTGDSIHGMGAPVAGAGDSDIPFQCAANDTNLYGVLVNEGTNTWVASLQYDTALLVDQN